MQKKLLAAVVASMVAGQAMALEVYNDDTTSLSIGGRLGLSTNNDYQTIENDSSRINFKFAHKLSQNVTAIGVTEWSFDPTARSGDDVFGNRLGYVGLDHSTVGAFTAGKQWSVYSDIANWGSDNLLFNGGKFIGIYEGLNSDGGIHGTGRAEDAFAYRGSFNGLNIGLQYQMKGKDGEPGSLNWQRKGGEQIALSYDLPMGFSLGYTYNQTRFNKVSGHNGENAQAHVFGAKYDMNDLYVAFNYGMFKHHVKAEGGIAEKSNAFDLYGSYALNQVVDGMAVFGAYQQMNVDKDESGADSKEKKSIGSLGVQYTTGPMLFGLQYDFKDDKDFNGDKKDTDNVLSVNARYYF